MSSLPTSLATATMPGAAALPVPAPRPVRSGAVSAAIANAARATGNNFAYLLAQARLESGLDPTARATTSSARGLYQFTGATWLRTLDRHGASYGLDWASAAIAGGRVRDPAMRAQLLALRDDPQLSALMAGELANDNRAALTGALGRAPDDAELYLAHFLGGEGATRFLTALAADPGQSAPALLPRAAAANRGIFFAGGAPRSLGEVMDLLRTRLDAAGGNGNALPEDFAPDSFETVLAGLAPSRGTAVPPTGGPIAREFHAAAAAATAPVAPPATPSMADTLAGSFALADARGASAAQVPAHVRAAYGRLRAMGL